MVCWAGGLSWGQPGAALGCTLTLWQHLPGTRLCMVTSDGSSFPQVRHPAQRSSIINSPGYL